MRTCQEKSISNSQWSTRASGCGAEFGDTCGIHNSGFHTTLSYSFWLLSRTRETTIIALVLHCQQCKSHIPANKRRLHNCASLNGNLLYPLHGPVVLPNHQSLALQQRSSTWSFSASHQTQMLHISSVFQSLFQNHQSSKLACYFAHFSHEQSLGMWEELICER